MEKWEKTRTVLCVVLIHGSFENHEGHETMLWKNTHTHKISLTISEVFWTSFLRNYES